MSNAAGPADIVLVSCAKTKLDVPAPAKDLYTSPLFGRQRAYAEEQAVPWFILSAEHGLVAPDEWSAPYERYLPDTPSTYRVAWGAWIAERLELLAGPLEGKVVEIHAGRGYVEVIDKRLIDKGVLVVEPLRGLTLGERLAWYKTRAARPETGAAAEDTGTHVDTRAFVEMLLNWTRAVTPSEFLSGRGEGLKVPGLYSWWVDEKGAADLAVGLGCSISSGLIYAGLAGATRWPSGKRSTNTLWSRISGMHLGRRHNLSTFRLSLGSVIASATGGAVIDEAALTEWMKAHLKVVASPCSDADTLGRLEHDVLTEIDPPLNLQGMEPTPIRSRLTELRRIYK